jgi:hypothetical protein
MRFGCCLLLMELFTFPAQAQTPVKDSLALQLYAEVYASLIPDKPVTGKRPGYFYNYTSSNSAAVNLALARVFYQRAKVRSSLGLMAGTYAKNNLAGEQPWARHLYEASIGYRFTNREQVWLDAGVFPSHIGAETAIGRDNWTATRSIVADNSPYYETGLRLSYKPGSQWYFALLTLNGWQRITAPLNQLGANWGMQVTYTPNGMVTFNSSSFIGKVKDNDVYKTRIYSNLYVSAWLSKRVGFFAGWDFGMQEGSAVSGSYAWNDLSAQLRCKIIPDKLALTARYEQMNDPYNLLYLPEVRPDLKFNVRLASLNADWVPRNGFLIRGEINYQTSPQPLFFRQSTGVHQQFSAFLIASYNFQFSK